MIILPILSKQEYLRNEEIIEEEKPEHPFFQRVRRMKKEKTEKALRDAKEKLRFCILIFRKLSSLFVASVYKLRKRIKILMTQMKILTISLWQAQKEIYQYSIRRREET